MNADPLTRIRAERGLMAKIARELKISPCAVSTWRRVPANRARAVAQITGIPEQELRPDIFGPATTTRAASAA